MKGDDLMKDHPRVYQGMEIRFFLEDSREDIHLFMAKLLNLTVRILKPRVCGEFKERGSSKHQGAWDMTNRYVPI